MKAKALTVELAITIPVADQSDGKDEEFALEVAIEELRKKHS